MIAKPVAKDGYPLTFTEPAEAHGVFPGLLLLRTTSDRTTSKLTSLLQISLLQDEL